MAKSDNELIFLRTENARMSLKEMSQHLRKSSQRLKYSCSHLEKEGIITSPFCVFDYSYFGQLMFRVYFRGGYVSENDKARIVKELSSNPYIASVYELEGEFDLTAEFICPNPSRFNKELKKIITSIPTLNDHMVVLNLVTYLSPRSYLLKNQELAGLSSERIIGGDRNKGEFSKNETAVMKELLNNPLVRYSKLSKSTGLNIKTVKSVIKDLSSRHVIKGFRYTVNTSKLGVHKFRLFLKLHNLSSEKENHLTEFLLNVKEVSHINKIIGDWDFEIDLESFDRAKIRYILKSIRENFKELIERLSFFEFYTYYKRSYLSQHLFSDEENKENKENSAASRP